MGNNYNKMYKQSNVEKEVVSFEEPKTEVAPEPEKKPAAKPAPKFKFGTVVGCERLNIRKTPNLKADILAVIKAGDTVQVFEDKSTKDFYKITYETETGCFRGFCIKDYIQL